MSTATNHKQMLSTAIQYYLASRPESADTLEGIHAWWTQWSSLQEPQAATLAALEDMEAHGFVERARSGGREIWRRQGWG
jgi:hypothetical protein